MRDLSTRELHVLKAGAFRSDHHLDERATKSAVRALRLRELVDEHDCGCNGFVVNDYGLMVAAAHGIKQRPGLAPIGKKKRAAWDAAGKAPGNSFDRLDRPPVVASTTHRKPALPLKQKKTLAERSGGFCEIRVNANCTNIAVDPAHRNGTRIGGRRGEAAIEHAQLSNVMHACRWCHDWTHQHPEASKSEGVGWALEEWQEGARTPVLYRGELSWLTDDGRVLDYEEACA